MARRHIIQTWTSSVASPKLSLEEEGTSLDFRLDFPIEPPALFLLPKLPLLTASSSGVPG